MKPASPSSERYAPWLAVVARLYVRHLLLSPGRGHCKPVRICWIHCSAHNPRSSCLKRCCLRAPLASAQRRLRHEASRTCSRPYRRCLRHAPRAELAMERMWCWIAGVGLGCVIERGTECMCMKQGSLAHALPSCGQARTPRSPVCLMAEDTRPLVLYLSLHGSAELAPLPTILMPAAELAGQATRPPKPRPAVSPTHVCI